MTDGFSTPTHGHFNPVRTVTEKYHDDLMHDWKVIDVAKDKRIAQLEAEVYKEQQETTTVKAMEACLEEAEKESHKRFNRIAELERKVEYQEATIYTLCVEKGIAGAEISQLEADSKGWESDWIKAMHRVEGLEAIIRTLYIETSDDWVQDYLTEEGMAPPGTPE